MNCQPHAGHGVPCSVPFPLLLPLASSLCSLHFSSSIFVLKPPSHSLARCVPPICQKLIKLKIPSWKENTPKKLPGPKIIYLFYDLNFSNSFRWNFSFINFAPSHLQRIHRTPLALQTTTAISVLLTKAKMRHANCTRCRHIKNAKSVCGTVCVCAGFVTVLFFIIVSIVLYSFWLIWQKSQTPTWPSVWLGTRHAHIALVGACGAIKRRLFNENVFVLPKQRS